MTNYYDILEVGRDASESEIKKAYRGLSLKWHPDRNPAPEAKSKFQSISEAYDALSDHGKRQEHDDELNGVHRNPFMGGGGEDNMEDIGNIFNMMFGSGMPGVRVSGMPGGIHVFHSGGGGGGFMPGMPGMPGINIFQQLQKPPPIIKNIQLGFQQAYTGCTIHLPIEKWTIRNQLRVSELETMYVPIPAGIDEGEIIIMRDCGNAVSDELKGDVKLVISIENSTPFLRQGMDLIYKKTITLKESLTGFSFDIPHISGKQLCVNNHTNRTIVAPGLRKPIPGLGMVRDNNTGNLIIEFSVEFPESLTDEQTDAIGKLL
jgi:DnaJ family protein B protein 4